MPIQRLQCGPPFGCIASQRPRGGPPGAPPPPRATSHAAIRDSTRSLARHSVRGFGCVPTDADRGSVSARPVVLWKASRSKENGFQSATATPARHLVDRAFVFAVRPRGSLPDGLPGSRSPTPPSTPGTTASNRWLRSPRESVPPESSRTLAPHRLRAAKSSRQSLPSRRSASQPSVVAYVSPHL